MITKDGILALSAKRKTKTYRVKAWGDDVLIRGVSAGEMDHLESILDAYAKDPMSMTSRVRATACAYFLADSDGNRLFGDGEIDQLDALPASGLTEIYNEGFRFNKRTSVDELEKNSEPTPSSDSGTK